jgi:multisubunit Na+/H+ antiporter MnhE subunit
MGGYFSAIIPGISMGNISTSHKLRNTILFYIVQYCEQFIYWIKIITSWGTVALMVLNGKKDKSYHSPVTQST